MKNIKLYLRKLLHIVPGAQYCWVALNKILGRGMKAHFSGWGMTTHTHTPWHNEGDQLAMDFLRTNQNIITQVMQGKFKLSQFNKVRNKKSY